MTVVHNTVLCTGNLWREWISGTLTAETKMVTAEEDGCVTELECSDHFTIYMHVKLQIVYFKYIKN